MTSGKYMVTFLLVSLAAGCAQKTLVVKDSPLERQLTPTQKTFLAEVRNQAKEYNQHPDTLYVDVEGPLLRVPLLLPVPDAERVLQYADSVGLSRTDPVRNQGTDMSSWYGLFEKVYAHRCLVDLKNHRANHLADSLKALYKP